MADQATQYAINRGWLGTASILTTRRKYDLSDEMIYRDRLIAKFWNIMSRRMAKMRVTSWEPKMWDFVPESNVFPIYNNAGTATAFHIADTYGQQLQPGDRLIAFPETVDANVQTGYEQVVVQAVGATGSATAGYTLVTVVRNNGTGGTGAVNISTAANFKLIWAGNAVAEGAASGFPIEKEPGIIQNYIQTFTKDVGETRAEKRETSIYAKVPLARKASMKRELLIEEIEWALTTGTLGKTWEDGAPKRTTRGVLGYVDSTNIISAANKMGAVEFIGLMEDEIFDVGNKRREKLLLVGGGFKKLLDAIQFQESHYYRNAELTKLVGFDIQTIDAVAGKLNVVNMETWRGTGFYNAALWLDLDYLGYMYIDDLTIEKGTQNNNVKWNREQWTMFGDFGLFAAFPTAHGLLHSPSVPA